MKPFLLITVLALAGCSALGELPNSGDPAAGAAGNPINTSAALRAAYAQQLTLWNNAGVDPVQLSLQGQVYAATACAAMTGLSTVWRPDAPEVSQEVTGWCGEVLKTLAPAAE